jgi:hypothetical protein
LHLVSHLWLADFTAGREFHHALKTDKPYHAVAGDATSVVGGKKKNGFSF